MEKNEKYFWIKDDYFKILLTKLIKENEDFYLLEVFYPNSEIKNKMIEINKDLIQPFSLTGKINYFEDMVNKNFEISNNNILNNIRNRFYKENFYNFIGEKILIKLNNNNKLDYSYRDNKNHMNNYNYNDSYTYNNNNNDNHNHNDLYIDKDLININKDLFKFIEKAFIDMKNLKFNQTIILNGESGSGKVKKLN